MAVSFFREIIVNHFLNIIYLAVVLIIYSAPTFAENTNDSFKIQVFNEPSGIYYGRPDLAAPMKSGVRPIDYDSDGQVDLIADGTLWKNTGRREGKKPVYKRAGKGKVYSNPGDFDSDQKRDYVLLKDGKIIWLEEKRASGDVDYNNVGNLQFVLGGDLTLPGSLEQHEKDAWSIAGLGDYDNDGKDDVLLTKYTMMMLGNDVAYVPWKFAGFNTGWIENQWIFADASTSIWICRNVGTKTKPAFTMPRQIITGEQARGISYPARSVSAYLIDWNTDGKTDIFTHVDDYSVVYLNTDTRPDGSPFFGNGKKIKYGSNYSMDHRKAAIPFKDNNGLLHIVYHGGSVIYETVQLLKNNPFAFSEAHWVLFENPTTMELDIFAVPDVADLNGDGKKDLIVGSECGLIWYFENLDADGGIDKWSTPKLIHADGKPIRMYKEYNLQGPIEYLIGYSNPTAEDWDLDGDIDLLIGNHGEVIYYFENVGNKTKPEFKARGKVTYGAEGDQVVPMAWRSRPGVGDLNQDGLPDLITVSADRKLTIWPRYRDKKGNLHLKDAQKAVNSEGYPFNVCRTSRGIGRSKFCVVDWDNDGLNDIITSAGQSLSARTEFIYYYKNMGMKDDQYVFEFRPNQIKVTGHIQKGSYTHFRMLEPVDWDNDGEWEAIAGIDGRHPIIRNTWLYYWDQWQTKEPEFETLDFSGYEFTVKMPESESDQKEGGFAVLEPAIGGGEIAVLNKGEEVFQNRNYVFNDLPKELRGKHFIRPEIESSFSICMEPGLVYALVPPADGPRRNCYIEYMESLGFSMSSVQPFQLFGKDPKNKVIVMQKKLEKSNKLVLGKWALIVFK